MKLNIDSLLDSDRGVSPVIGVILMVAITVILAAVIGTFVLGLGDSLNQAPQATLNADSNSANTVTISHNGGDALPSSDITVNINGTDQGISTDLEVGDSVDFTDSTWSGDTVSVKLIHNPSQSILLDTEVEVQ